MSNLTAASTSAAASSTNATTSGSNGGTVVTANGGRICKKCDSNDIEVDRARGISYCTRCGNVLEESIIVSEVQIEETSGGGCNVVGQFVSASDTRAIISINGLQNTFRVSKEITLQNGRRLINEMASQLRLNQHCMDTAFNFYKLAVQRGLTRGRKIRQVIAACLYLVCRTEGTPHLLLDLCDCVHDDACYISSLGKLAMKFAYLLCIKLPEIDPGLFIPRFAQKLNFGAKTQDVTLTALRLVQRMNRDWMAIGRRPSGLCGAALLVSARLHDFHLTLDDIVRVVKVGKTTLRKRMLEFEDTPSSNLTVDEFHTIDLEQEHDPPAYTRSRKFAKIKQIEEMVNIEEIEKEIIQLQESIESALSELQKAPRGPLAKYAKLEKEILGTNSDLTNIDLEEAEEFLSQEQINIIRSIVIETGGSKAAATTATTSGETEIVAASSSTANTDNNADKSSTDLDKWNNLKPTLRSLGLVRESIGGGEQKKDEEDEDEDDLDDDEDEDEDEDGISDFSDLGELDDESENDDTSLEAIRKRRKKYMRLKRLKKKRKVDLEEDEKKEVPPSSTTREEPVEAVKSSQQEIVIEGGDSSHQQSSDKSKETDNKSTNEKTSKTEVANNNKTTTTSNHAESSSTELDLSGIDDSEIDSMILSKEEIKTKAKLWLTANKDWLKEQKMKEDQRRKEREEMGLNGNGGDLNVGVVGGSLSASHNLNKPKKTRIRRPKNTAPVANPQEAIERMLQEKKLSSKINYDVLKNLNKDLKKT